MLCNVSLKTPLACSLVCFPGMTSSLAKLNKSSGAHFLALFLKFPNFLIFLNSQIDLLILKTYYGQFSLTTKKSLHIIFKAESVEPVCRKSENMLALQSINVKKTAVYTHC